MSYLTLTLAKFSDEMVSNTNILNFSMQLARRVHLSSGIGYLEDITLAKKAIKEALQAMPNVLAEPES